MNRSIRRLAGLAAVVSLLATAPAWAASDAHFKKGYELFKAKNYSGALAELTQSSEMTGSDYNFFLLLANTHIQLKQWNKAIEPAQKAVSLGAGKKEPIVLLATAHMRAENYKQAAAAFEDAVKLVPGDFQLNSSLGYAYYKAEDHKKAIPALEKALAIKGDDFTTVFTLGAAYVLDKQCAKGEPYLEKAKAMQPKQEDAISNMLRGCYANSGDSKKAVAEAKEALAKDPKDVNSLTFLAQSAAVAKDWDEATGYYTKLAELKPKSGDPHFQIGNMNFIQKKYTEAAASYEKALAVENKCEWRTQLGAVYQTQGIEIDNEVGEAVQADPDTDPDADKLTAMLEHYKKAKAEFDKAVKACKSADAKKGIASINERVAAWEKYQKEAEEGVPPEEAAEGAKEGD